MVRLKWLRLNAVVLFVLVSFACWTDSKITSSKKELKIRNKREGEWTEWGSWTQCSRSCDGGIRTQSRQCQIRRGKSNEVGDDPRNFKNVSTRHCEGHSSRHHICNVEECSSGSVDFRESQCKAFDNRAYMGKVYSWESFIDERTPCSLTCRAKGFRFFATLNKSVIDGTPCKSNPFESHRCISGICMAIGCDGIAGSQRRLDKCGVCGGDADSCRVVSGIFTRSQLSVGYNVVAHIPRGACSLNITQLRKSTNRLALRKGDGTFVFNGDWRISWPGIYDGAGTKFYYDPKLLESIASPGPLNEPLDLMVLYQQPNQGIKYEYVLPLGDSIDPLAGLGGRHQAAATYRPTSYINHPPLNGNSANAFNTISSFPKSPPSSVSTPTGSLVLYPGDSASAYSKPENQAIHPHLHNHQGRRRGHNLNKIPGPEKKFHWAVSGYTNCTESCGGGTQRSIVRCVKSPASNPVSDRRCVGEEKPVTQAVRCNVKPCPAEWHMMGWSSCSEQCGDGLKTRAVFCQQKISQTLTMRVAEGACLKAKPESQMKCFIRPCHRWEASEWSQCSAQCGNGIRRRTVICLDSKGKKIDPKDCDDAGRPTEILPCNMSPCEGTDWFMSEWSPECSQQCGGGVQTRHVLCSGNYHNFTGRRRPLSSEAETNSIEDEDESEDEDLSSPIFHCNESKKPVEERECFTDRNCGDPAWFSGEWSECSTSCGNGLKTRQVLCVLFSRGKFKVVENPLCDQSIRPEEKAVCESNRFCSPRWFGSEWSECSVNCGGGTQKRSVSCRSGNWTRTSSYCADMDRPLDKRSCNEQKCAKITDATGMVKDTSPTNILASRPDSFGRNSSLSEFTSTTAKVSTVRTQSRDSVIEEPVEDSECSDQYRNCPLVVQARLCRYKYYRSVCCNACSETQHEFNKN